MIVYYDHIVSVFIAGAFIMVLAAFQSTVKETASGKTMLYTGKKQTLALADMLERDLANVGYKTPPGEEGILGHTQETISGVDVTKLFEFWTEVAGARTRVRYQVASYETAEIDGEIVPLFKLTRFEDNGGGWEYAGGSASVLTTFRIDMRTNKNQPTTDVSAARALRVRLATAVAPQVKDVGYLEGMRILRWGVLMRPPRLQNYASE